MLTEIHCTCGHAQSVDGEKLPEKVHCSNCGKENAFRSAGAKSDAGRWLMVGGHSGPARLAVAVQVGERLILGSDPGCWIVCPGVDVAERQTEIELGDDGRLRVKHVSKAGGTWINRSKVYEGVVGEGDTLRLGPYVMSLRGQAQLPVTMSGDETVVIEDAPSEEAVDTAERRVFSSGDDDGAGGGRRRIQLIASILVLIGSSAYLAYYLMGYSAGSEMPADTVYRCPIDGTTFRAAWNDGTPKCPNCGQLCLGMLEYKGEGKGGAGRAGNQPASARASETEGETAAKPAKKPAKKKNSKKSTKKKTTEKKDEPSARGGIGTGMGSVVEAGLVGGIASIKNLSRWAPRAGYWPVLNSDHGIGSN